MTAKSDCTRPKESKVGVVTLDPCNCSHFFQCTTSGIIWRSCPANTIFNPRTGLCPYQDPKICDSKNPWNRCKLEDFNISKGQIQSEEKCREFWPKSMAEWKKADARETNHTKTSSPTTTTSIATTATKWSLAINPLSVTVVQPTSTGNDIRTSHVPPIDQSEFSSSAAKTYIPVIVCAMIALVAFLAIIILWKKRSDVKAFVAGLCCGGGQEMSKSICNPSYENTLSTIDTHLDLSTGEHVYNEIPCMRHSSATNRPLPKTPPQQEQQQQQLQNQQSVRASTFSGFVCPDVVIRKEQLLAQRTNSACKRFDRLTSCDDRSLIDAQERFASEYQVPGQKNREKSNATRTTKSDWKTQGFTPPPTPGHKTRRGRSHRNHNSHKAASQKGSRHGTSSGKLVGIDEHSELSTLDAKSVGTASVFTSENSQSSLSSGMNNFGEYSGVWDGVSVSSKIDMN